MIRVIECSQRTCSLKYDGITPPCFVKGAGVNTGIKPVNSL
ncbi:hypothetical protein D322_2419 [Yersinia enterocolitica IP 10393]|uniref:Uncharacterized protein n=1 Tax=Yersinia enterocolitica W22703 TaxID=913028 RepID=F4MV46_YEREN|nr:unknown protein [Yersinia enterocolitica W22703]CCO69293.1 hypothetical protein D322_2419 [Yersinia enterocolitica IP 10393]